MTKPPNDPLRGSNGRRVSRNKNPAVGILVAMGRPRASMNIRIASKPSGAHKRGSGRASVSRRRISSISEFGQRIE